VGANLRKLHTFGFPKNKLRRCLVRQEDSEFVENFAAWLQAEAIQNFGVLKQLILLTFYHKNEKMLAKHKIKISKAKLHR
jgi:hypothetical protein